MPAHDIFIVHPSTTEQVSALKAFIKALKIKFEISSKDEYNPEFVAKIEKSRQEFKDGKFTRVKKRRFKQIFRLVTP